MKGQQVARVKHIKKARASKKNRKCVTCGHSVQPGEAYKRIDKMSGPRSSYTLIFCSEHNPRTSHLLSGRNAELAEIVESIEDSLDGIEENADIESALESAVSDIEEFSSNIRESAENMEMGFGHSTAQTEAMNETANELEEWVSNIESLIEEAKYASESDDDERDFVSEIRDTLGEQPDLNLTGY